MSIGPTSQCSTCRHFRSPFSRDDYDGGPFCKAFPEGIPDEVYGNQLDHRQPVLGDHGVRWEADGDMPFPDWALQRGAGPTNSSRFFARVVERRAAVGPQNHPGHADQSSHGRRKSSIEVRKSLVDASTTSEVAAVVASGLEAKLGHPVKVILTGMDPQVAREHGEGLLRAAERFPSARLGSVSTYGQGGTRPEHPGDLFGDSYAVTTKGRYSRNEDDISFNVSQPPATYRAGLALSERVGWVAVGTPTGVALHEFGHVVAGSDSGEHRAVETAKASATVAGQTVSEHVSENLSRYAGGSTRELAAEAFADVMVNGSEASGLAQSVFTTIERDYNLNGARR